MVWKALAAHIEESNIMDGISELICQLLLSLWSIELRQVERDQIGPID